MVFSVTPSDGNCGILQDLLIGYRGFKIQFWDGLERDIPRFRAAREAVGRLLGGTPRGVAFGAG